jgi:hypothetical protein
MSAIPRLRRESVAARLFLATERLIGEELVAGIREGSTGTSGRARGWSDSVSVDKGRRPYRDGRDPPVHVTAGAGTARVRGDRSAAVCRRVPGREPGASGRLPSAPPYGQGVRARGIRLGATSELPPHRWAAARVRRRTAAGAAALPRRALGAGAGRAVRHRPGRLRRVRRRPERLRRDRCRTVPTGDVVSAAG